MIIRQHAAHAFAVVIESAVCVRNSFMMISATRSGSLSLVKLTEYRRTVSRSHHIVDIDKTSKLKRAIAEAQWLPGSL